MQAPSRLDQQQARRAQLSALHLVEGEREAAFDGLLSLAVRVASADAVAVVLFDGERAWSPARCGVDVDPVAKGLPLVSEAMAAGEAVDRQVGQAQVAVPIGLEKGPAIGALWVMRQEAGSFPAADIDSLSELGRQLNLLLELRLLQATAQDEGANFGGDAGITLTDAPIPLPHPGPQVRADVPVSDEDLFQLLTSLPIGVMVHRADDRRIFANDVAYEMVGLTREATGIEALWTVLAPYLPGADRPLPPNRRPLARAAAGESVPPTELTLRRYGEVVPVLVSAAPVFGSDGRVRFGMAAFQEMSRVHLLERQLRQAQKLEAVGRLAGGVAHDFNNLLTAIFSFGQFAIDSLHPTDPVRGDVEEILKAANKAEQLTRQLLAFSRKQTVQPRVVRLNTIVESISRMLGRLVGEDVELVYGLSENPGNVRVDAGALEQVIVNLVVNAKDAMPAGGKIIVETRSVRIDRNFVQSHEAEMPPGSYEVLSLSDTGVGMDPATQAQIFDPFFSTKGPSKGTGLGLSTCYGIVKQAGGFIWAYSELGVGTTFKIYLPHSDSELDASLDAAEDSAPQLAGNETILLVEDDAQVRQLATRALAKYGYVVLEAANGGEGLLICEDHEGVIDLLLTDVVMPRMSGRRLAERALQMRPGLPVLFMSGYTDDAIAEHGIVEEGVDLLQKPFAPRELIRRVRKALTERPTLPTS